MSIATTWFRLAESEARSLLDLEGIDPGLPRADLEGLGQLEITELAACLTSSEYAPALLCQDSEEGPFVLRVPDVLVQALARAEASEVAEQLAARCEALEGWSPAEIAQELSKAISLAQEALSEGQPVWSWPRCSAPYPTQSPARPADCPRSHRGRTARAWREPPRMPHKVNMHGNDQDQSEGKHQLRRTLRQIGLGCATTVALAVLAFLALILAEPIQVARECASAPPVPGLEFESPVRLFGGSGGPIPIWKVTHTEWLADARLAVDVTVGANCGAICWTGDYEVDGNALTLLVDEHIESLMACGENPVELRYVISGLPRRDYDIRVEPDLRR